MASKSVTIILKGSLSHTMKLPGQPELKLVKGRPHVTDDPALVEFAKSKPHLFSVTGTLQSTPAAAAASAKKRAAGKKGNGKKPAGKKGGGKKSPAKPKVEDDDES